MRRESGFLSFVPGTTFSLLRRYRCLHRGKEDDSPPIEGEKLMTNLIRFPFFLLALLPLVAGCQSADRDTTREMPESRVVEAACGQCQLGLEGEGCTLAVRIDGQAYFVEGTGIDDHGDAHAADGFCNSIRRARVIGEVEGDRYVVTELELIDR